jgi:hypothetical protein
LLRGAAVCLLPARHADAGASGSEERGVGAL